MPPPIDIKQNINATIRKWKRSNLYFSSIFNSIHLGIIITDNHGLITLINQSAVKAWEIEVKSCIGKPIKKMYSGFSQAKIEYYLAQARDKGTTQSLECFHYKSKQDVEKFFHLDFVPLIDEQDQINGTMIIGTDITEKKLLEKEKQILEGLLPICSYCKKIRDDRNEWTIIEKYIKDRSRASFTHSICPNCMEKHFP